MTLEDKLNESLAVIDKEIANIFALLKENRDIDQTPPIRRLKAVHEYLILAKGNIGFTLEMLKKGLID